MKKALVRVIIFAYLAVLLVSIMAIGVGATSSYEGYLNGYFVFYLSEGEVTLSFEAEREAVVFGKIELIPATDDAKYRVPTMKEYLESVAKYPNGTQNVSKDTKVVIEGEMPDIVSDNAVFMTSDRSSAINSR